MLLEIKLPAVFTWTVFLFPHYHSRQHSICSVPRTMAMVCCPGVMLSSGKGSLLPGTLAFLLERKQASFDDLSEELPSDFSF